MTRVTRCFRRVIGRIQVIKRIRHQDRREVNSHVPLLRFFPFSSTTTTTRTTIEDENGRWQKAVPFTKAFTNDNGSYQFL